MFLAGDEFCNTQFGNNNSYCQDNEISWLDWSLLEKNQEIFKFFQSMIRFRKEHPSVKGNSIPGNIGFSPISIHTQNPRDFNITDHTEVICVMYASRDHNTGRDDIVYLAVNAHWEQREIVLPSLPASLHWHLNVNTGAEDPENCYLCQHEQMPHKMVCFTMEPRSVAIFTGMSDYI